MAYPRLGTITLEQKWPNDYISAVTYHHSKKSNQVLLFLGTGLGYICVVDISDYFTWNHIYQHLMQDKPFINHPLQK